MKHRFYLPILSLLMMVIMMTAFSTAPATIPNGAGVQKYNPGLVWAEIPAFKGQPFHAIFPGSPTDVPAGEWVTIHFGVTSGAIDPSIPYEESVAGIAEFMETSEWFISFDGEDITQAVLDGERGTYQFFFEIDGVEYQEVFTRWAYYLIPQSIGCYDYYGIVEIPDFGSFERAESLCWLPLNMF